ncbi:MAG: hypothetical protein LBR08_06930 [Bacteroidales bacterium]|jgi:hypothetical protein|nr:hypothetical protein [Bacteroidales bacterium]
MANRDWLPSNHEGLYDKAAQTWNYLNPNRDRLGFSGTNAVWLDTVFVPKHMVFNTAFLDWKDPAERTPTKTGALTTAEKDFRPTYRQLYTGFLKNSPNVTDADLIAMGLPKRSSGRTPAPEPDTIPEATVEASGPATLMIRFRDAGEAGRAKPDGVHGAEIAWAVLDKAPINWDELIHSSFDTRSPFKLSFKGEERGKRFYFAIRWENTRGVKGQWSDIQSAIIP